MHGDTLSERWWRRQTFAERRRRACIASPQWALLAFIAWRCWPNGNDSTWLAFGCPNHSEGAGRAKRAIAFCAEQAKRLPAPRGSRSAAPAAQVLERRELLLGSGIIFGAAAPANALIQESGSGGKLVELISNGQRVCSLEVPVDFIGTEQAGDDDTAAAAVYKRVDIGASVQVSESLDEKWVQRLKEEGAPSKRKVMQYNLSDREDNIEMKVKLSRPKPNPFVQDVMKHRWVRIVRSSSGGKSCTIQVDVLEDRLDQQRPMMEKIVQSLKIA